MELPFQIAAHPSPKDYRDIQLTAVLGAPKQYPDAFEVDTTKLPVWNQKKIGSCTSHAGTKYKQRLELDDQGLIDFSPRFAYAVAKCTDGFQPEGTYPRLIMQIGQKYGFATTKTVPNNCDLSHDDYVYQRDINNMPKEAFEEAKKYKIKSYAAVVPSVEELKQAIVETNGCIMLMTISKNWYTAADGKFSYKAEDLLPLRYTNDIIGRHEVYVVGYKTVGERTLFKCFNSFSDQWANKGYFTFWHDEYKQGLVEAITAVDVDDSLLEKVHGLPKPGDFTCHFDHDLKITDSNDDVKNLQIALMIEGVMSPGDFTDVKFLGYFGEQTQQAVKDFQKKNSLRVTGLVDVTTRSKLNQLYN